LDDRLHVVRHGAREAPRLRAQPGVADQLDCPPVLLGHAREADLDAIDAEPVEQPRDLQLLLGCQDDADGLLTVAQRRVVKTDPLAGALAHDVVVDRPRPDLGAVDHVAVASTHCTFGGAGSPCASSHEITGLRRTPMRSISASMTSPALRYSDAASSLKPATPDTVPVETTSPALYPSAE